MGITAHSGPLLQYGITTGGSTNGLTGNPADYNDQRGPMVADLGYAMMDPRAAYSYAPGGAVTQRTAAFYQARGYVDFVPFATSSIAIVSVTASSSLASTALTLQAASSARGTFSVAITAPETGATTGSLLTFDSTDGLQFNSFGASATIKTWAPNWGAGRCVSVYTASYSDSPVTVHGRDIYGYKVSEVISISSNGSYTSSFGGTGQKAFKQIDGVYNSSAPTSTGIAVGTTARFGFPWYVPYYGQNITVFVTSAAAVQNIAVPLSTANAILALASTATAGTSNADVRGVYISSVTYANDYRLTMSVTLAASAAATVSSTNLAPIFGATQYST